MQRITFTTGWRSIGPRPAVDEIIRRQTGQDVADGEQAHDRRCDANDDGGDCDMPSAPTFWQERRQPFGHNRTSRVPTADQPLRILSRTAVQPESTPCRRRPKSLPVRRVDICSACRSTGSDDRCSARNAGLNSRHRFRMGETLTEPVLLAHPSARAPAAKKKLDTMLLLPAFGLLCCGVAGLIINGIQTYQFLADPNGSQQSIRDQLTRLRGAGFRADDPPTERDKRDDECAEETVRVDAPAATGVRGRERGGLSGWVVDGHSVELPPGSGRMYRGGLEHFGALLRARACWRARGDS